jgi:hypothetical protein
MENQEHIYGIHENGDPLTLEESNAMQVLDVTRFTKSLGDAGHMINEETTLDERHQFESLLSQVVVTTHGDPAEEWEEFKRHKDQQNEVLKALFENSEGREAWFLFVKNMAPLFGDGTKRIHMPVEQFERRLEDYFDLFCRIPHDIVHLTAEHNKQISFHTALTLISTKERIMKTAEENRRLTGEVLASFVSEKTGMLLPQEVVIDVEVTPNEFEFALHQREN